MKTKRQFQWMAALVMGMAMTSVTMTSCSTEDNPADNGEVIENENGKEELDLGGGDGVPMVGAQGGYIYDAKVLGCKDKTKMQALISKYQNDGWEIIDKDLNAKAAGKYIYLAVKTCNLNSPNQGTAITNFYLTNENQALVYKDGQKYVEVPCDGDSDFNGDLNAGAGGSTIRLFHTAGIFDDQRAVTKVIVNNEDNGALGLNATGEGYDLNYKTKKKGEKIYMHIVTNNVARWRIQSTGNCTLKGFIGDTKGIKTVSIPVKFDGMDVFDADGELPDLEVQNYFLVTKVTWASALNKNAKFKQVNVIGMTGNIKSADTLPPSIENIALEGFKGTGIEKIYLPFSLKKIDNRAFMDCTELKTIYFGEYSSIDANNELIWNDKVVKGDDWNKNVHADFNVAFLKGTQYY